MKCRFGRLLSLLQATVVGVKRLNHTGVFLRLFLFQVCGFPKEFSGYSSIITVSVDEEKEKVDRLEHSRNNWNDYCRYLWKVFLEIILLFSWPQ